MALDKKALPHIDVKNKGPADLYFQFLDPSERKEFFEDLTGADQPTVKLPDFGKVDKNTDIVNDKVKELTEKDLSKDTERFIERFIRDYRRPQKPYLEYDEDKHRFELKPKYDLEKMIQELSQRKSS